jgi:hypothetical protein
MALPTFLAQAGELLLLGRSQDRVEFGENACPDSCEAGQRWAFILRDLLHFRYRFPGLNGRFHSPALLTQLLPDGASGLALGREDGPGLLLLLISQVQVIREVISFYLLITRITGAVAGFRVYT